MTGVTEFESSESSNSYFDNSSIRENNENFSSGSLDIFAVDNYLFPSSSSSSSSLSLSLASRSFSSLDVQNLNGEHFSSFEKFGHLNSVRRNFSSCTNSENIGNNSQNPNQSSSNITLSGVDPQSVEFGSLPEFDFLDSCPIFYTCSSFSTIPVKRENFTPIETEAITEKSNSANSPTSMPPIRSLSLLEEMNIGPLLIGELSHKLNTFRSVRQSAEELFDRVLVHERASLEKFISDKNDLEEKNNFNFSDFEAQAAKEAKKSFESQSQRIEHFESLAALCFRHCVNQHEIEIMAKKKSPRAPKKLLNLDKLAQILNLITNKNNSPPIASPRTQAQSPAQYTEHKLTKYQKIIEEIILECEQSSAASLTSQALINRPLLVEACKPSFIQYASLFVLNLLVVELTISILNRAVQLGICQRRNHNSLSAAALFLSMSLEGIPITQHEFCRKISLTEVTLRKVIRELGQEWEKLVTPDYKPKNLPHFIQKKS